MQTVLPHADHENELAWVKLAIVQPGAVVLLASLLLCRARGAAARSCAGRQHSSAAFIDTIHPACLPKHVFVAACLCRLVAPGQVWQHAARKGTGLRGLAPGTAELVTGCDTCMARLAAGPSARVQCRLADCTRQRVYSNCRRGALKIGCSRPDALVSLTIIGL